MNTFSRPCGTARVLFLDYGGVLADEGFMEGMQVIARERSLSPDTFVRTAVETAYGSGYVVGQIDEAEFWQRLFAAFELSFDPAEMDALRTELLSRFRLRPYMLELVEHAKAVGLTVAILSDQTSWLDDLERRDGFFERFDTVFNSYHTGLCKRDPACFQMALDHYGIEPGQALFLDDATVNIETAKEVGLLSVHFDTPRSVAQSLARLCPELPVLAVPE